MSKDKGRKWLSILLSIAELTQKQRAQLVAPQDLRHAILRHFHDVSFSGHMTVHENILSLFWWPEARRDVHIYSRTCDIHQKDSKKGRNSPIRLLKVPVQAMIWFLLKYDGGHSVAKITQVKNCLKSLDAKPKLIYFLLRMSDVTF